MIQTLRLWRTSKEQLKRRNRGRKGRMKGNGGREKKFQDIGLKVKRETTKQREIQEETGRLEQR